MKALGIVCEYNPLHNGHIYQINKAKELTSADVTVAVMSGNFVQRGEPAIIDKYTRTECALNNGIDLVVEMPTFYAISSAEFFAKCGVSTLAALCCDYICFGSESGDLDALYKIAELLTIEPVEFKEILKASLKAGDSFPKARENALTNILGKDCLEIIGSPNNILAIEYLKEIIRANYPIKPITIKREGDGYNADKINSIYASASSIRNSIQSNNYNLSKYMPSLEIIKDKPHIFFDDLGILYRYKIRSLQNCKSAKDTLCTYREVDEEIASILLSNFDDYTSLSEYALKCKSKNYTLSRIKRCILNIILNINDSTENIYKENYAPYIRILGFNKKGQTYLSEIKKNIDIPLITKIADHKELLYLDNNSTSIYNQIIYNKSNLITPDEFHQKIIIKN